MRFALKAISIGMLGVAAALLVSCGDSGALLSGGDASSLQNALAAVDSACANGQSAQAQLAAQHFSDQVAGLSPQSVDRRLIANLQQGASTLEALATRSCTRSTTTSTTPTTTTPTTTTPTTTATTPTQTTTTPTTPTTTTTTPTTPSAGGGTTTPNGGGPPGNGNGNGPPGGSPPGHSQNPGGAAPSEGGG